MSALVGLLLISLVVDQADEDLVARLAKGDDVAAMIVRRGNSAIMPLAKLLQNKEADLTARLKATIILGDIGGKHVVGPLRKVLSDETIQWAAAQALGRVGPAAKEAVPEISKIVKDRAKTDRLASAGFVRDRAIAALAAIGHGSPDAIDALTACMSHRHCPEAAYALLKLGEAGAEALLSLATKYIDDERSNKERKYGEAYSAITDARRALPKELIPLFVKHIAKAGSSGHIAGHALALNQA